MTANEWLKVMQYASDFPEGLEKLIIKYGEMLLSENKSIWCKQQRDNCGDQFIFMEEKLKCLNAPEPQCTKNDES